MKILRLFAPVILCGIIALWTAACGSKPADGPKLTAFLDAARRGDLETVRSILKTSPDKLYESDSNHNTALGWAILERRKDVALFLLEAGHTVNPADQCPFPPVMSCISRYTETSNELLEELLKRGADPNVSYAKDGWRALPMAVNNGQVEKIRLLAKYGADPGLMDGRGESALGIANGRLKMMRDPNYNCPHGELSDPAVRQREIDRWENVLKTLRESFPADKGGAAKGK